jgi:hypothetical protein
MGAPFSAGGGFRAWFDSKWTQIGRMGRLAGCLRPCASLFLPTFEILLPTFEIFLPTLENLLPTLFGAVHSIPNLNDISPRRMPYYRLRVAYYQLYHHIH